MPEMACDTHRFSQQWLLIILQYSQEVIVCTSTNQVKCMVIIYGNHSKVTDIEKRLHNTQNHCVRLHNSQNWNG